VIIATADHGDMLGERGLWYKMTFFERAVRVPLIICAPQLFGPRRVPNNVSLVDMLQTLLSIAEGGDRCAMPTSIDGASLMPLASGRDDGGPDTVYGEYLAEGTSQPIFMIRRGSWKYIACAGDPPQHWRRARNRRLTAPPGGRRVRAGRLLAGSTAEP